ncbi:MAG TPA: ABC transporter permease [Chryseolinea sp.]|nr:ABC transporter permease [Chryseolinea sp.]
MKHPTTPPATPPQWAVRFFHWFCNDHLSDAVMGDLNELHQRNIIKRGKRKADFIFVINVLLFLQPFAIRQESTSSQNQLAMLQNYLKMAWRTMGRHKTYTAIKIGGFALGIATCMVIYLFIRHEMSYDQQYKNGANIYRVYNDYQGPDGGKWTAFPASMGPILKTELPEIEKSARMIPFVWFNAGSNLIRSEDQVESTYEEGFAYADQELLEVLEIPIVYGNPLKILTDPNTIVLSRRKAEKYFPGQDPTGKTIVLNDDPKKTFTVGGVMENFPPNHHLSFDFFITLKGVEFWPGEQASWCCWNYNVYLQLRPDADPVALEKKMLSVNTTHNVGYLKETGNKSAADEEKYHKFILQPVSDIYLKSEGISDAIPHGDLRYIWLFGSVAVFILLLACINFVNLSTAKSANRAKEVGLRKVVGSFRFDLVRQFLMESLLYSFLSFSIAIFIVIIALPYFNSLAGKSLIVPWNEIWLWPALLASAVLIGVVAGMYPSFYLSAFKPIDVLKGKVSKGSKSSSLRGAMVIFQFTTSIVLIIGTFVIYRQMNFILNTKIGFDKEHVLMIQGANTLDEKQTTFKNELLKLASVKSVTAGDYLPVSGTHRDQNGFWKDGKSKEEKVVGAQLWHVDEDYISTMGMKLLEGRNFNPEIASDSQVVIVNQAMVKAMGLKNPLEEKIMNWETFSVIGVVEDFHFESMKEKITPLCFAYGKRGSIISVKIQSRQMTDAVESITKVWNKFMPHQPIRYTYLDESYARMYDDVQRTGKILTSFAVLAVIIACLGLFALSAFMVEQRNKEMSIRLVLGASVNSIFRLLTQNFIMMVFISFVIAIPLGIYLMEKWLNDFQYKIPLTWDVFAMAGAISLLIAVLTVSYQSLRAARANPASRLRSE